MLSGSGHLAASLAFALLFSAFPTLLEAQRSLEIEDFRVNVMVGDDAGIRVVEYITVRFNGKWNGFFRTIPVEYENPQGFGYRLFLDLEDVREESGRELRTEVSRDRYNRKIKVWVPGAQDVTRTLTLRYTIPNALKFF